MLTKRERVFVAPDYKKNIRDCSAFDRPTANMRSIYRPIAYVLLLASVPGLRALETPPLGDPQICDVIAASLTDKSSVSLPGRRHLSILHADK